MSVYREVISSEKAIVSYTFTNIDNILYEKSGNAWLEYRKQWNDTNNIKVINDIPLYILLELNSFCNFRCKMCKHGNDEQEQEKLSMPMEIYEKIVDECRRLKVPSINIGTGTECTLHPRFEEIALRLKETGAIDKFFLTNGSTLDQHMIDIIFEGEYERVEISVDAATEETYSKIRINGNFNKLEQAILNLICEREKRKSKLPIIRLSFCVQEDNMNEIDSFYEKWKDKVDVIEYQKVSQPYAGEVKKKPIVNLCLQPFNRLTIDYRGNIYPCCSILYYERYCLGNIKDISIYDAWHSEKMNILRNGFVTGNVLLHCNECLLALYGKEE